VSKAIAHLQGEIANDMKLTPGGLLVMNVLVHYEGPNGPIPNYIPTKFFKPDSEKVYAAFKKGDQVEVLANIKMNKAQGEKYYQINLIGEAIKPADDKVADIAKAFDATDMSLPGDDDSIPF